MYLEDYINSVIRVFGGIAMGGLGVLLFCFGVATFLKYIESCILLSILLGGILVALSIVIFCIAILIVIDQ